MVKKTSINLGLNADYSAKSSYVAVEKKIHKSSRFVTHSLYFKFAVKVWTPLRTRVAHFPLILPVFAKVAIFRNIVAFSMY